MADVSVVERAREIAARAAAEVVRDAFDFRARPVADVSNAAIDAFLSHLRSEGYKIVGREATEEMALVSRETSQRGDWREIIDRAFGAMWDAAPDLTSPPEETK